MSLNSKAVVLSLLALPLSSHAQEAPSPNALELAGHRALQRMIAEAGSGPNDFTTDGCSGGLSASWRVVADTFPDFANAHGGIPPWEACCVTHDRAYHAGGYETSPEAGFADRATADDALRACVVDSGEAELPDIAARYDATEEEVRSAYRTISEAMYLAARFGGGPCSGLPWRWGYGSDQCVVRPGDFRAAQD